LFEQLYIGTRDNGTREESEKSITGMHAILIVYLLIIFAPYVEGIYFYVGQGQKRCFLEEMPGQTLFLATYNNPDYKPFGTPGYTDGTAVIVRVLDPSGGTVLSRTADVSGKIAFHSSIGGEYQLCFNTNSSYFSGSQKFVRLFVFFYLVYKYL